VCCSVLQCVAVCCSVAVPAVCCSVAVRPECCSMLQSLRLSVSLWGYLALTSCRLLSHVQHTATHCNTLQHTATYCNTLQPTIAYCYTLLHTAKYCNLLQHIANHCNILQHLRIVICNLCCLIYTTLQHTATRCDAL